MGVMDGPKREKMVIGLRLEYLSRSPEVRAFVSEQLALGGTESDPFVIIRNISVSDLSGDPVNFDVIADKKGTFAANLNKLLGGGTGSDYIVVQNSMVKHNRDHTPNRDRIVGWWEDWSPGVFTRIKDELEVALEAALARDLPIRFFWDCTLTTPTEPQVVYREEDLKGNEVPDGIPTIVFQTDEKDEADTSSPHRGPISDPAKAGIVDGPEDPPAFPAADPV